MTLGVVLLGIYPGPVMAAIEGATAVALRQRRRLADPERRRTVMASAAGR